MRIIGTTLALVLAGAAPAAAQSAFGDTALAYRNGVVYDDDLVPGGRPNQSYQGGGTTDAVVGGYYDDYDDVPSVGVRTVRRPVVRYGRIDSPNLIGRDGRAIRY